MRWSRRKFAYYLGTDPSTVSRWERRVSRPQQYWRTRMGKLDADLDLQQMIVWMKASKESYGMDTSELDELLQKRGYLAGANLHI